MASNRCELVLHDGSTIAADAVVWATGYRTGLSMLELRTIRSPTRDAQASHVADACEDADGLCDGASKPEATHSARFSLHEDHPLFEHILLPRFPVRAPTLLFRSILIHGCGRSSGWRREQVLALTSTFLTAPGPLAAREAADYLVYHM